MKRRTGNKNISKAGAKTQFKKGVSGNPKGKPPGISVTQYLRELSEEEIMMAIKDQQGRTLRTDKHTRAKAIAMRIMDAIVKDPVKAARLVELYMDRTEGKVSQPIEVKTKLDLSKLTKQELELLKLIHSKAATE